MNVNLFNLALIVAAFGVGFHISAKKAKESSEEKLDNIRTNVLDYLDLNFAESFENVDEIIQVVDAITESDPNGKQ